MQFTWFSHVLTDTSPVHMLREIENDVQRRCVWTWWLL